MPASEAGSEPAATAPCVPREAWRTGRSNSRRGCWAKAKLKKTADTASDLRDISLPLFYDGRRYRYRARAFGQAKAPAPPKPTSTLAREPQAALACEPALAGERYAKQFGLSAVVGQ